MAKHILPTVAALALAVTLSACAGKAEYHPADQSGAQPPLPAPKNFLMPPMQVPKGVGWADGQSPSVAEGLKIERIAANLLHPRRLLTLPNGDVLVVEGNGPGEEPVTTPKQWIAGKVKARSGKAGKGGNRVTLLRRSPGTNTWTQHVYIEGLHSPFGIQLIGDTLYVANTGNIMQYHYVPGETRMSDKGREFTDLPSTINHHWTKELLAMAASCTWAWVPTATSPRMAWPSNTAVRWCWKWTWPPVAAASSPRASATRPAWTGNQAPVRCGPWRTSATRSVPTWCRIT